MKNGVIPTLAAALAIAFGGAGALGGASAAETVKSTEADLVHAGTAMVWMVDAAKGTILLAHGRIESMGWEEKTRMFTLKDPKLATGLRSGDWIGFEFTEAGNEYLIHRIEKRR